MKISSVQTSLFTETLSMSSQEDSHANPTAQPASDLVRKMTDTPICSGDDGLSSRLHGITFPKWRNESIKAYGNAVVPHLPYAIFKTIEEYERIKIINQDTGLCD